MCDKACSRQQSSQSALNRRKVLNVKSFWVATKRLILALGLLMFAGFALLVIAAWITHRHLNSTGIVMLCANIAAAYSVARVLRAELSGGSESDASDSGHETRLKP